MINEAWWYNFQSHKETHIVFDAGVNALVGLSDAGKTALLRGLIWLITNKPSGEEFRSSWGGDTKVRIRIEDIVLERGRTDDDNYYLLHVDGCEPRYFRAFGQGDPPQEILEVLNINNEFNIAKQMDSAFLLSENEGEVAKILNRAVNLEVIDSSLSAMRSKKDKVSKSLRAEEENVKRFEKDLLQFDNIAEMEVVVSKLESIRERRQEVLSRIQRMTEVVANLSHLQLEQQKHLAIVGATNALQAAIKYGEQQREVATSTERLSGLVAQMSEAIKTFRSSLRLKRAEPDVQKADEIRTRRDEVHAKLERLEGIGISLQRSAARHKKAIAILSAEMLVNLASQTAEKRAKNAELIQRLEAAISGVLGSEHVLASCKRRLNRLQEEFAEEMPEECPLCGTYTASQV